MRLSEAERKAIKDCAAEVFGSQAEVRLFGSRVDDSALGGDIDLYIETDSDISHRDEARFIDRVAERIGDQKIDIVVHVRGSDPSLIERTAQSTSVAL